MTAKPSTFKRITVGQTFTHKGERFRKNSTHGAFKINPNGSGQTHAEVKFSRSAICKLV